MTTANISRRKSSGKTIRAEMFRVNNLLQKQVEYLEELENENPLAGSFREYVIKKEINIIKKEISAKEKLIEMLENTF